MVKKKAMKSYSEAAIENINEITKIEKDLVKSNAAPKDYELTMLTAIANALLSINLTLSGIADYYMRCEKQFDYTTEEMTTLDVKRIVDEVKNTLDPKYREELEDQNGKD